MTDSQPKNTAAGGQTADPPEAAGMLSATDLAVASSLPLLLGLSWGLPERAWPRFCAAVSPLAVRMHTGDPAAAVETIRRTLGAWDLGTPPARILAQLSGEQILAILQLLRAYRPGGWSPAIRVAGWQHVEAAQACGKGLILWVGKTVYGDLVAKMAFHRAGLAVSHLSRASHGFSGTRFGVRVLNPIQTRVEDRYLRERVSLTAHGGRAALQILADRLAEGGAVSITVHRNAKRPVTALFLDGQVVLAPGAPVLARRTGATLLPVFAFRDPSDGLMLTVEAPLEVPDREDSAAVAVAQYAERLVPYVLKYPGQWSGWFHL